MPTHSTLYRINNRYSLLFFFLFGFSLLQAQTDSIFARLTFNEYSDRVQVEQYFNLPVRGKDTSQMHLYAWVNAYRQKSVMSREKLRRGDEKLYFAKDENLGRISDVQIYDQLGGLLKDIKDLTTEVLNFKIKSQKNQFKFSVKYNLKLPADGFTGYGYNAQKNSYFLKYFLLHPGFFEDGKFVWQNFKDLESLSGENTYYRIKILNNTNSKIFTDLQAIGGDVYEGDNRSFFELALLNPDQITEINVGNQKLIFQEKITEKDSAVLKRVLSKQFDFLAKFLPALEEPLFISNKLLRKTRQNFIDDVKIPLLGKYKIYPDSTRLDLKYIHPIVSAYCNRILSVDKRGDHWLLNGFKGYLILQYLKKYHKKTPILGKIPEDLSIWKIHPLHWYESSKFGYIERYPLYHRYFMKQNIDQPIDTPYDRLRPVNQKQVSEVKTGLAFDYLADYLAKGEFDRLFKNIIDQQKGEVLTKEYFKTYMLKHASKDLHWFFDEMIKESGGFDMFIARVKDMPDSTIVSIKNKNQFGGATEIVVSYDSVNLYTTWVQSRKKKFEVNIPKFNYNTITLKHGDYFPETNLANNVYRKDKWQKTKLKLSPVGDIQIPDFYQLFLWPNASWNNYDKLQLGLRLTNETIFPQDFVFRATPMYSFGSGKIMTGANVLYKYLLYKSNIFREIDFYAGMRVGHFQKGLEYYKYSGGINFKFKKDVLSSRDYYIQIGFEDIQRQLPQAPTPIELDLKRYQLLNTQFVYRDYQTISESTGRVNIQYSNKFAKLSSEFYHRWKLSKNRRMGVRAFAGVFFNHKLESTKFYDYGLDRITDYTYSYNLLGRSESNGILSQQFVLAEGGFKSMFGARANKLMFTLNLEYPIVKMIDVYTDAGMYQNKGYKVHFTYDTGIRLSLVPDFVELYFPIQSTLGFEPTMPKYHQRIRFLLNLNLGRIRSYWREQKLHL